ncbi:MAG: fumarylacetoacetate hydrolase family protein, partial [Halobacteriales archaeon]|nr:fumarylacetoacetate hydrolase family protein [Halobacteriales archaeon]
MKLATIPAPAPQSESERRDGRLVVVDDAHGRLALVPPAIAPNLREALERWEMAGPALRQLAADLKAGALAGATLPLSGQTFMAPLPRTTSWIDGSAFIQHILLVRKARNADPPADLRTVPLMYQGTGDPLLGPREDIALADESWGIDFEAEVAVVLDDTPMGTTAEQAADRIRLVLLMNDVSLRNLIPRELAAGFGFFQGKPATSFAPFAVTPGELGSAWRDGRVHLDVCSYLNGRLVGSPDAGEMHFSFPQLVAHAARTRHLPAGTILGSGTVSNADESRGCGCLAEVRTLESIKEGKPRTPFMKFGDRVRIEASQGGRSVFGAIEQQVVPYP